MRRYLLIVSFICTACAPDGSQADADTPRILDNLSDTFSARIGVDGIDTAAEARFLDDGRRILVLDRYSPHLRLFDVDGTPLWKGGRTGGGPAELHSPQAIGSRGDVVLVLQPGTRISRWILDGDSLRFDASIPLSAEYAPLGIIAGCSDEWILYARNDSHFVATDSQDVSARIDYLHALRFDSAEAAITPLWGDDRDATATLGYGHSAALIGRWNRNIAVWHRSNAQTAGRILQFDCSGEVLAAFSESDMVMGDRVHAQIPRPAALEWTSGIVALDNGFAVAMHRYFSKRVHQVPEAHWKTEIFGFVGSEPIGSVVLNGQWQLMDSHERVGVLLTSVDPVPHFVRLPVDSLLSWMRSISG